MDRVDLQNAEVTPAAAEPVVSPQGQSPAVEPTGAAPVAATSPSSPTAPVTTPVAAPPSPSISEQEFAESRRKAEQFDQLVNELRSLENQKRTQEAEQRRSQEVQSRLEMAFTTAQNLAPEDSMSYLRRVVENEVAQLHQERQRVAQEVQAQYMAAMEQMSAPVYAAKLAGDHKLPPEYAQRLMMIPPREMDRYVPILKAEAEAAAKAQREYQAVLDQLEQLRRSQQAGEIASTGAHTVSEGSMTPPGGGSGSSLPKGTIEHLLSLPGMARIAGVRTGG